MDDIEVEMESGGTIWIQAKRSLELSANPRKPLASAFDQLVRQFLRDPSLDPSRHRLVLAYQSGSESIAALRAVVRQFRSDSPTVEQAAPDGQARTALKVFKQIVEVAWGEASGGSLPTWSDLSRLMKLVAFWELKEGDQGRVEVDPNQLLGRVVENETDTPAAADALLVFVSTLAKERGAADTNGLREALLSRGIKLRDPAGFAQQIEEHLCKIEQRWANHRPLGVLSKNSAWSSTLKSSDVFVSPRLQLPGSHIDSELRAEEILARTRQGRSVALLGHVGTGKSTLLLWCAARLAARHREVPTNPVPIWLHARLVQESSWPEILERHLPGAQQSGAAMTWCLIIDGVDEVGIEVWSTLAAWKRRFSKLVGLVVASRPTASPAPEDGFETLHLAIWSPVDIERFLASWSYCDSKAVTRLRTQLTEPATADLLSTPLTATAALLIANENGVFPRSRAGLFEHITELLIRSWWQARSGATTEFVQARSVLVKLAQLAVRGVPLTTNHVQAVLSSQAHGAAQSIPDEVERHLGVLVRVGSQHFEFVHRSLAEYLVGDEIRTVPSMEFEQLARASWSREVARHAIGLNADRGKVALAEGQLRELAALASEALFDETALRAVSTAIATAADLVFSGVTLSPETTEVLAETIMTLLTEEFSTWVGDTICEHVRRIARAGGPLWEAVLLRMLDLMRLAQFEPVHWYLRAELSVEDWIVALFHRDPEVRAVAVDRLTPEIERPEVQQALFRIMSDEGHVFYGAPPAMRAGLAWRMLPRGPNAAPALNIMRNWLASPGWYAAGAAALALRPSEAPPQELAQALRWLSQSYNAPQEIIDELMSTPQGERAMQEVWPDWATRRDFGLGNHRPEPAGSMAAASPPSHQVRVRIVHACGPQLATMDLETMTIIGARSGMVLATELIASGCLERALDLQFNDIPIDAQHELGALLLRSPEARQRVLQAWPQPEGHLYPGIALEPLIEAGDCEAAEIYREFLPKSPYCWGICRRTAPTIVLEHPAILPVACERALYVIEQALTPDHEGHRLAVSSAARVLRNLAAAWSRDHEIIDRVWCLLDIERPEGLMAVLDATYRVELEAPRLNDLFTRVHTDLELAESSLDNINSQRAEYIEFEIEWIEDRGFARDCCTILRKLGRLDSPLGWRALAALWPELSENERMMASTAVAENAMEESAASLPLVHLERFVRIAPTVWCDALVTMIEAGSPIDGTIGAQALTLFPRGLQLRVAQALRNPRHSVQELPWRAYGYAGEFARPADTVRRLLFELG